MDDPHREEAELARAPQRRLPFAALAFTPDDDGVERPEGGLDPLLAVARQHVAFEPAPAVGDRVLDAALAPAQIAHQRQEVVELVHGARRHRQLPGAVPQLVAGDVRLPVERDADRAPLAAGLLVVVGERLQPVPRVDPLAALDAGIVAEEREHPGRLGA